MTKRASLIVSLTVAVVALACAPSAQGCPFGRWATTLSFEGTASPLGGADWSSAVGIDFGDAVATEADGAFAGLAGTSAPHSDFSFSPSLEPHPVSPLWTVGAYSFTLRSVRVLARTPTSLVLRGSGILVGPGVAGGAARSPWGLTAEDVSGVSGFSSVNGLIPEPASISLFALGLLGAAGLRTRLRHRVGA